MATDASKAGLPLNVECQPAWLTWVAATTIRLRALGMTIRSEPSPSGRTRFDWGTLDHGVRVLGRSTLVIGSSDCHTEGDRTERT